MFKHFLIRGGLAPVRKLNDLCLINSHDLSYKRNDSALDITRNLRNLRPSHELPETFLYNNQVRPPRLLRIRPIKVGGRGRCTWSAHKSSRHYRAYASSILSRIAFSRR